MSDKGGTSLRISRVLASSHLLGSVLFSARSSRDREGRRQFAYDGSHHRLTGRPVSQPACTYQRQKWAPPAPVCALPVSAPPVGGWCLCAAQRFRVRNLFGLWSTYIKWPGRDDGFRILATRSIHASGGATTCKTRPRDAFDQR